jgi:hypothetical protein
MEMELAATAVPPLSIYRLPLYRCLVLEELGWSFKARGSRVAKNMRGVCGFQFEVSVSEIGRVPQLLRT